MKSFSIIALIVLSCALILHAREDRAILVDDKPVSDTLSIKTYSDKIHAALLYARQNKMDTSLALLIDYSCHSGKKRAFLVDLQKRVITDSFMVSHGCGNMPWAYDFSKNKPQFSNEFESHCSSLGKYKIGQRAYSSWGINVKYVLHGMESTNSNALKRLIVMHGWGDVPDQEVYPSGTPEGWGCPAFSNAGMQTIDTVLQKIKKPVLLWAFI
jgi:hypothetical protein